ncbi:MAG: hypothetical protein WB985_12830 [Candidatus Acidiferrales bacterium]
MTTKPGKAQNSGVAASGPAALGDSTPVALRDWDPKWAEICLAITNGPLADGVLAKKLVKRIAIAIRTSAARLDSKQMRQLIHGAIEAEASRDEILMVVKMATIASIRSISAGAAILVKEASMEELDLGTAVRKTRMKKAGDASSVIEKVKAAGLWNEEWDHVYFLALVWIEEFMLAVISVYESKVLSRKEIELLNVALGASHTPINAVGVQRHIGDAFRSGATVDEIVEVFKICVAETVGACNQVLPILSDELSLAGRGSERAKSQAKSG